MWIQKPVFQGHPSRTGLTRMSLPLFGLTLLSGCLSDAYIEPARPSTAETLALGDGLYTLGSTREEVLFIQPGAQGDEPYAELAEASVEAVALGGVAQKLVAHPDGKRLLALTHTRTEDFLVVLDSTKSCALDLPVETGCLQRIPSRPLHDVLEISPSGRYALSYISSEAASNGADGVVNLNQVVIYDLQSGESLASTVGYGPQQVHFAENGDAPRAILLTRTSMAVVELESGLARTRELSVSSSSPAYPSGLVVTGDEHYALVTFEGRSDLYTLDLTQSNLPINILALSAAPKSLVRSTSGERTALLSSNGLGVDVVEHADLSISHFELSHAMSELEALPGREQVLLTRPNQSERLSYVLDLSREKLTGWTHESGYAGVDVSPDGGTLVFRYPVGSGGSGPLAYENAVGILRLDLGDKQPIPLLLGGVPEDVLFLTGSSTLPVVATLFSGETYGYVATLSTETLTAQTVEVLGGPTRLFQLPGDGRLVTEYSRPLGLLGVMPADDLSPVQFFSGYRAAGLN